MSVATGRADAITRRPAIEPDRAFLEDVHVAALGPIALIAYGWPACRLREHFRSAIDLATCHVMLVDGRRAGYIAVEDRGAYWHIEAIAIAPNYQRKGLGSAVLRDVLADAGHTPVRLNVVHVNPARALYDRLGFRVVDRDHRRQTMEWRAPGH